MRHHEHGWKALRRGFCGTAAVAALLAAACSGAQTPHPAAAGGPGATGTNALGPAMVLEAMPAPYQLPEALSRDAVLSTGSGVLIVGGLTRRDTTADAVTRLDPVNGTTRVMGHLTYPVRDAAGAVLGGQAYVFGGRGPGSTDTVQAVGPGMDATGVGRLPAGRWGAAAVTAGAVAYLIGGCDGKALDPAVLATADGRHFRVAARLRVPVRYAAT